MKIPLLSSLWTSYLSSQLPCHPSYVTWSREHVIPTSIIANRTVTQHHQNIIPMPKRMNNARGNRPYTKGKLSETGYTVRACDACLHSGSCLADIVVTPSGVIPSELFKGPIARSVLRSLEKYPMFYHDITEKVLDAETALEWNSRYPPSVQEIDWIYSLKRNSC